MSKQERLTQLIQMIYAKYPSGGALHIILDDGNTEDGHIQWCIDHLDEHAAKEDIPCRGKLYNDNADCVNSPQCDCEACWNEEMEGEDE